MVTVTRQSITRVAPKVQLLNEAKIPSFADARDLAIASLIPIALTFPTVDPRTGYGSVPLNSMARLVGLLHCHQKIENPEQLAQTIEACRQGVLSVDLARRKELHIPRWMVRHAQTSLVGVQNKLPQFTLWLALPNRQLAENNLKKARQAILKAETVDLPKLIELTKSDISMADFKQIGRIMPLLKLGSPL